MFVLLTIIASLIVLYNFVWKRRNLPPGPVPIPLIGNLHTFARLAPGYDTFEKWSKNYGPVFTFWMAEDPIVAVTDYEIMRDAFVKDGDAYAGRDFFGDLLENVKATKGNYGISRGQGEEWQQLKRFSLKLLRNLGMGRNVMEQRIMLELDDLIEKINHDTRNYMTTKEGFFLLPLIDLAVGSVINQTAFGFRFSGDKLKNFFELRKLISLQLESFIHPTTYMIQSMPWLRHLPYFSYHFNSFIQRTNEFQRFFDKNIDETIERVKLEKKSGLVTDQEDTYFIKAFIQEMEQKNTSKKVDQEEKVFINSNLKGLCYDLFIAGLDTTSNTMKFLILYMIVFPEIQNKMQHEMDLVMGHNEDGKKKIYWSDKTSLPYTNAVINETQRFLNLLPINLIHQTTKDVVIGGHSVSKGTRIVPMISSVLYNEKIFPKPHEFIPERFIEHGQLKKCEELIPFSLGKRQCPGESLARMELFLLTANLFYLFKISEVDPTKPPTLRKITGLTVSPVDYSCVIEKRKQNLNY